MHAQSSPNPFTNLLSTLTQAVGEKSNSMALVCLPPPGAHVPAPLPDAGLPAVSVSPPAPPIFHARPRTGAVASLPKEKRDMVCRMIANGVSYKKIAQALKELGLVLTERNICNWVTHGGYAEWCALYQDALQTTLRQDDLLQYHRRQDSPELAEVGLQSVAARLSELLLRQASPGHEPNLSKLEPVINVLCRINKELLALQKYRDGEMAKAYRTPARIRVQEQEKQLKIEAQYSAGARPKLLDNHSSPRRSRTKASTPAPQEDPLSPPTAESAPPPEPESPPATPPTASTCTPDTSPAAQLQSSAPCRSRDDESQISASSPAGPPTEVLLTNEGLSSEDPPK